MDRHYVLDKITSNIKKVIAGKDEIIKYSLVALLAEGHLLLEDVPGVGKTTLAKVIAATIGTEFSRIQFTPDTLPSDVTGVSVYNIKDGTFSYVKGGVMSNIVLADEINRTSPKTQSSLLEAMAERQVTVDGKTYKMPRLFMVIATQNPIDFTGTYKLLEAQKDRFFMKLSMGYPDINEEKNIITRFLNKDATKNIESAVTEEEVIKMQEETKKVSIHQDIVDYILNIAKETRENTMISLGMSPRATLALVRGCQALAYYNERDYVIPDDVLELMGPVINHRILLSNEAKINQLNVQKVMKNVISKVKIPIL